MVECYRSRISGSPLDYIDVHVEVPASSLQELKEPLGEPSDAVPGGCSRHAAFNSSAYIRSWLKAWRRASAATVRFETAPGEACYSIA